MRGSIHKQCTINTLSGQVIVGGEEEDVWPDRESLWWAGQRAVLSPLQSASGHRGTDRTPEPAGRSAASTDFFCFISLQGDDMKRCLGLFLLACFGMLHLGEWTRITY